MADTTTPATSTNTENGNTVTLSMQELLYDIQNKTYLTGRSRDDLQNHEAVAHMQASADEEDLNQILRSISKAYAELKTHMSEYMDESKNSVENALTSASGNLEFKLNMPSNHNNAALQAVADASHAFIVNTAVGEWFAITNKADSNDYFQQAQLNVQTLRKALYKRKKPVYPAPKTTGENTTGGETKN